MFNENLQVCDWPANVAVVRPECGETKKRKLIIEKEQKQREFFFIVIFKLIIKSPYT